MGRKMRWPPRVYHNKARGTDWIRVRIAGKPREYTLGPHGSPEAAAEYTRLVAELQAGGLERPPAPATGVTVSELFAAYYAHAEVEYAGSRNHANQLLHVRRALGVVRGLYGPTPARDFGPLALQAARLVMVADMPCPWCRGAGQRTWRPAPSKRPTRKPVPSRTGPCKPCEGTGRRGWSRGYANRAVRIVRRAFRWGVGAQLVAADVWTRLQGVEDLRRGQRLQAGPAGLVTVRQGKGRVRPPAPGAVEATLPHLLRVPRAIVELMRLTGARADEITQMRPMIISTEGRDPDGRIWPGLWVFTPDHHKTEGEEVEAKVIFLGARCQEILRPFLERPPDAYCFSPAEAMAEFRAARRAARKTPVQPSQVDRRRGKHCRRPGGRYTTHALGHAIRRAARKAGVPHFSPHMLRHGAGTVVRGKFSLDHARASLGHRSIAATALYAEADLAKAAEVARQLG